MDKKEICLKIRRFFMDKKEICLYGVMIMCTILFIGLSILSFKAKSEEDTPPTHKALYMCKFEGYMDCRNTVGQCLRPFNGTEEWEAANACINGFFHCIATVQESCNLLHDENS